MDEDTAIANFLKMGKWFFLVFLISLLFFIFASRPIASFFHTESIGAIIIVGFAVFGTLLFMVVLGFLQGLQRFRHLAYIGYILPPGLKFLFGIAFILAGWRLLGALGAVIVAEFGGLFAALLTWRKRFTQVRRNQINTNTSVFKLVIPGLVLAFFITAPTNLDVALVTHFFSANQAGIYVCAATFGKVITFLPIGVSLVMLPMVAEKHAIKKSTFGVAFQGLLFTFILSASATLVCWLLPAFVISLFFGKSYLGATTLVGWYCTAMMVFALNLLLVQYAIAIGKRRYTWLAGLMTLGILIAISYWHTSLEQ